MYGPYFIICKNQVCIESVHELDDSKHSQGSLRWNLGVGVGGVGGEGAIECIDKEER